MTEAYDGEHDRWAAGIMDLVGNTLRPCFLRRAFGGTLQAETMQRRESEERVQWKDAQDSRLLNCVIQPINHSFTRKRFSLPIEFRVVYQVSDQLRHTSIRPNGLYLAPDSMIERASIVLNSVMMRKSLVLGGNLCSLFLLWKTLMLFNSFVFVTITGRSWKGIHYSYC